MKPSMDFDDGVDVDAISGVDSADGANDPALLFKYT
jgi:hypothetical protein